MNRGTQMDTPFTFTVLTGVALFTWLALQPLTGGVRPRITRSRGERRCLLDQVRGLRDGGGT